jgi:hypothetical protein
MLRSSLRYSLLTFRYDQLWFPASIWGLFVIVILFLHGTSQAMNAARGYLGAAVPLIGGIMAAYAVLDDPALELRFATASRAGRMLLERLGLIFIVQTVCALSFQVFTYFMGIDLSILGSAWAAQLAWLVPTLALMALGCAGALSAAQTAAGAVLVGVVWLVELVARGWFAQNVGKYVLVFMGALMPDHPDLAANQLVLTVLAGALFLAAWWLLRRQERYI